jgi:hypothetical protein
MVPQEYSCVLDEIDSLLSDIATDPDGIENLTLDSYLDGMRAWLEAYQKKHNEPLTWKLVATMIRAASIYE